MPSNSDKPGADDRMSVSWRTIAVVSIIVAVAALITVAIISSTGKEPQILNSLALALSILSFAATLAIALQQFVESSRDQEARARLNAETRLGISEIERTATDVLATVRRQNDQLLEWILNRATQDMNTVLDRAQSRALREGDERMSQQVVRAAFSQAREEAAQVLQSVRESRRADWMEDRLLGELQEWLSLQEDVCGTSRTVDGSLVWKDASGTSVAIARTGMGLAQEGEFTRWVNEVAQIQAIGENGDEVRRVLVTPSAPRLLAWEERAQNGRVTIVWPDVFSCLKR